MVQTVIEWWAFLSAAGIIIAEAIVVVIGVGFLVLLGLGYLGKRREARKGAQKGTSQSTEVKDEKESPKEPEPYSIPAPEEHDTKIHLQHHLMDLIEDHRLAQTESRRVPPLSTVLKTLDGISWMYAGKDSLTLAQMIIFDLANLGTKDEMKDYLERSKEAREMDLEGLLSEFHVSDLD